MNRCEMPIMRTLTESHIIELRDRLSGWLDRLKYAKTRSRLSFFVALNVVIVLAVLPFLGAVTDQTAKASVRAKGDFDRWPITTVPAFHDKAIYLHSKLMKTAITRSGAPMLRFVECRHYAHNH